MDRQTVINAILSGNAQQLEQVLPKVTRINHTHIERAFLYICAHGMPAGSAYQWEPPLEKEDLPDAIRAFDMFFGNFKSKRPKGESVFQNFTSRQRSLFYQLYHFIRYHYNDCIEPGTMNLGYKPRGGVIRYQAYRV